MHLCPKKSTIQEIRKIMNIYRDININIQALRVWFFPLMALGLALFIVLQNATLIFGSRDSVIYTYVASFLQGNVTTGAGPPVGHKLQQAKLLPGDIILGGFPDTAYGKYSHAGIYLGDGVVLEGYADTGISRYPVERYEDYSHLAVLRVRTDQEMRNKALAYALDYEGACFYPVAFKSGGRYWNCTKIIWKAYLEQGINLEPQSDFWIAPEQFSLSPEVDILLEKGTYEDA